MSFFRESLQLFTKNPAKIKGVVFLNEPGSAGLPINPGKKKIDQALIDSKQSVLVLRDLHLCYKGREAWFDYIIISMKYILILEANNTISRVSDRQREFIETILLDWLPENNPRMWEFLLKTCVVSTNTVLGQQEKLTRKERDIKMKVEEMEGRLRRLKRANTKDFWIPEEGMHVLAEVFLRYHEPIEPIKRI